MSTTAPDVLATIVAAARRITEVREAACPARELERLCEREPRGDAFVAALEDGPAPRIIAECKRRSPSRGILRESYDAAAHAVAYERAGAAAISVLTEPAFFDGSLDDLRRVRAAVRVPILRKDFVVSEYQVLEAVANGADAVLLIVRALEAGMLRQLIRFAAARGLAALVEVHDERELEAASVAGATVIGVNSRDLTTLTVHTELLERIAPALPRSAVAVAESGIRSHADVARLASLGYQAFLVGERLIARSDPGGALRELRSA